MSISKHPLPFFSHEIRLGLVLYGGVSLAIYMNGICQEFYNAIRGRGIYKLIKALTDSDIVVDIVSGTSAGGVNGVLLSYAIANSSQDTVIDFKNFTDLWIENGDIKKLIRKKTNHKDNPLWDSFLDGEGFYQTCLENAFKEEIQRSPEDDWYSGFGELDLFITATDLDGRVSRVPDNTGKIIEIKDHRALFHLKYRQDQVGYVENPFKPEEVTQKALAKLCRMTSCFPVAFPVVEVELYPNDNHPDYKLVNWGKLTSRELDPTNTKKRVLRFVDGGVLNNRPFTSTIQTIYDRSAFRITERKLFYIDPCPDQFPSKTDSSFSIPYHTRPKALESDSFASPLRNPLQIAFDSKVEIPNYQSISRDLESIKERNRKVIRNQLLKQSLEQKTGSQLKSFLDAHKQANTSRDDDLEYNNYLKCRLLGLLDSSIKEISVLTDEKSEHHERFLREAAEILNKQVLSQALSIKGGEDSPNGDLHKFYREVVPLDLAFFIRKHCSLLGVISSLLQDYQTSKNLKHFLELKYLAYQLSWQFELLHIIQKSCNKILEKYNFDEILDEARANQTPLEKLFTFLMTYYETLLDCGIIHDELQVSLHGSSLEIKNHDFVEHFSDFSIEVREENHGNQKHQKESWQQILDSYYELFTVIRFPTDINFDLIDWADLTILLPEQQTSLAKKIFAQIYKMPVCQVLIVKSKKEEMREVEKWKVQITRRLAEKRKEGHPESVADSVLSIINNHSRQLINSISIKPDDKTKLLSYFDDFEVIDKILYPYEYLSEIVTKNTVELVRISPNDANKFGFGNNKDLHAKLSGYKFNAFGGFFKQAWRSNDILWGRLDGLDRIVTALITPQSIKRFLQFSDKYRDDLTQEEYLGRLINESLPGATDDDRAAIINYLLCIDKNSTCDSPHAKKEFEDFLGHIIAAGQRQILVDDILQKDLDNTKGVLKRRKEQQKISSLEQSIKEFKEQLACGRLDDNAIKQLDCNFESYQSVKQQKSYSQVDLGQLLGELIRDIPFGWMKLRVFIFQRFHNWHGVFKILILPIFIIVTIIFWWFWDILKTCKSLILKTRKNLFFKIKKIKQFFLKAD
jgi:patatin-related protein